MTNAQKAVEAARYDEATRLVGVQGAAAGKSVTNSSPSTFTMDGSDATIGGAFITTDNTKDGTSGTLIALKAFTDGDKSVSDGDTLNVTYTIRFVSEIMISKTLAIFFLLTSPLGSVNRRYSFCNPINRA